MEIPHWENTDKWGPLRDIVNQIIDSRNAALDLNSTVNLDVIQANTDVYSSKTMPSINWENVNDSIYARRNGKTVELSIFITADWVDGFSTSFNPQYELKDLYKGEEDSVVVGTLICSKQLFNGGGVYPINPAGYVTFDSSGNLSVPLEDGLMFSAENAVFSLHITYQAKNDISDFIS